MRHALEQRFLGLLFDRYSNTADASLRGMSAEDHHLVFDAERRQQRRDVAGVPVAQHVPQPGIVPGTKHLRELFGRPRFFPNRGDGLITLRTGELLIHLLQRCSDDVVVVHVRADALDRVEPQPVNQIEIAGSQGWRMRAQVVGVGAAAAVIDDQPHVERLGLVGALPGVAEQAGLILGGQRRRLADVDVRRAQADHAADDGVDDVAGRDDQQADGTADPLGQRHHVRQQPPLV